VLAGLCDLLDGSLARASGQVTAFGAFLDSVIDRYSDLVVLLGIVVLFARTPNARGALVAMAGLVGSVMVSYTKARAESIGIECNVGVMERPERMICLIAGALLDQLEPALWVLAILANVTALQRIVVTRRLMSESMSEPPVLRAVVLAMLLLPMVAGAAESPSALPRAVTPELEKAWTRAIAAYQDGDPGPVTMEFSPDTVRQSGVGDHLMLILADALARRDDLAGARAAALSVADHQGASRLAPRALLMTATLASRAGDEAGAQTALTPAGEPPRLAGGAGGAVPARPDGRARPARQRRARLPGADGAGADDRLGRRCCRSAGRARGGGHAGAAAHHAPASRARRAAAARRRPQDRE
jgi:phosphatidylglycerophosphate synthase